MNIRQTNTAHGFTLVELITTLFIATLLLTIAIPNFTSTIRDNRLTTYTNELVASLSLARNEAVKRGLRVTVCKSIDQVTCSTSTTDLWSNGWLIFTDQNNNGAYNSSTETLLRVHSGFQDNTAMTGNTNVANYISYISSGQSQLTTGAFQSGTIKACDNRTGNVGKNITLNSVGRVTTTSRITCP